MVEDCIYVDNDLNIVWCSRSAESTQTPESILNGPYTKVNVDPDIFNRPDTITLTKNNDDSITISNNSRYTDYIDRLKSQLRTQRNLLLSKSDYLAMPDYPLADKTDLNTYRQQLRDLPEQYPNLTAMSQVVWPTSPTNIE